MSILRAVKNLMPVSLRHILKQRLPKSLSSLLAATPSPKPAATASPSSEKASTSPASPGSRMECPICGTPLLSVNNTKAIKCSRCGSLASHRRLALALYAEAKELNGTVLLLGSETVFRSLSEEIDNAVLATDLKQVPPELHNRIDLCVHSQWLQNGSLSPIKTLRAIDALLSPQGKQIFSVGASSRGWNPVAWNPTLQALTQWLERKGWPSIRAFDPDISFGPGAGKAFACRHSTDLSEAVIILPKAERRSITRTARQ